MFRSRHCSGLTLSHSPSVRNQADGFSPSLHTVPSLFSRGSPLHSQRSFESSQWASSGFPAAAHSLQLRVTGAVLALLQNFLASPGTSLGAWSHQFVTSPHFVGTVINQSSFGRSSFSQVAQNALAMTHRLLLREGRVFIDGMV